jgi:hypothetical protein
MRTVTRGVAVPANNAEHAAPYQHPDGGSTGETWPPPWVGSFDSEERNLGERSEAILRAEFGRP